MSKNKKIPLTGIGELYTLDVFLTCSRMRLPPAIPSLIKHNVKANEILTVKIMLAIVEFKAFDLIVYLRRWGRNWYAQTIKAMTITAV